MPVTRKPCVCFPKVPLPPHQPKQWTQVTAANYGEVLGRDEASRTLVYQVGCLGRGVAAWQRQRRRCPQHSRPLPQHPLKPLYKTPVSSPRPGRRTRRRLCTTPACRAASTTCACPPTRAGVACWGRRTRAPSGSRGRLVLPCSSCPVLVTLPGARAGGRRGPWRLWHGHNPACKVLNPALRNRSNLPAQPPPHPQVLQQLGCDIYVRVAPCPNPRAAESQVLGNLDFFLNVEVGPGSGCGAGLLGCVGMCHPDGHVRAGPALCTPFESMRGVRRAK
jgi:hypothetical protein